MNPGPVDNQKKQLLVKALPEGWVLNGVLAAAWGSNLPELIKSFPDTSFGISFWEESHEIDDGDPVLVPKATLTYKIRTAITREEFQLDFCNIQFLMEPTLLSDANYILMGVKRSIYLVDTTPVQLISEDIIKNKMLMKYGSPNRYDGELYWYYDNATEMKIRELDDRQIIVRLNSIVVKEQLASTIDRYYSRDAKEKQKQLLLEEIDL